MSEDRELTFYAWADTHFGYEQRFGDDDIRWRAVRQMRQLPGWPYPEPVGGVVGNPALVLHCGDILDGGQLELDTYLHCLRKLDVPSYETLGNHDVGEVTEQWFLRKHGGRYYAFDSGGVHFVCLYKPFGVLDQIPPIDDEQLAWLEKEFAAIGPKKPVVTFGHGKPENVPNPDAFDAVLRRANVILMFAGHTHLQMQFDPRHYDWNGRTCVVLGHVRDHPIDPELGRTFSVVRIRPHQAAVVPWRWDHQAWARSQSTGSCIPEHRIVEF